LGTAANLVGTVQSDVTVIVNRPFELPTPTAAACAAAVSRMFFSALVLARHTRPTSRRGVGDKRQAFVMRILSRKRKTGPARTEAGSEFGRATASFS
jgi:hypothetical protein